MTFTVRIKKSFIEVGNEREMFTKIFNNLNEALDYIKLCYSMEDAPREI